MGESARILAVESMGEAKAALAQFAEMVERAMSEVDSDIQRMTQWLQQDRPVHWRKQVRSRQDAIVQAKSAISRKTLAASPDPVRAVEERKALARAEARLEEAQRRADATRRWAPVWEREAMGYKARAHLLREMVSGKIPEAIGRISRMMESLDAYLAMAPPRAEGGDEVLGPEVLGAESGEGSGTSSRAQGPGPGTSGPTTAGETAP